MLTRVAMVIGLLTRVAMVTGLLTRVAMVTETQQEAEVSKRRRDWAFAERDKIVMERESIRQLCDRLRRERDRAVSDQAKALRDADDVRKQKNEATKELKELKEHFQQCELSAYSGSSVAALSLSEPADPPEWENVQLSLDKRHGSDSLHGVKFSGGVDGDRDVDGVCSPLTVAAVPGDSLAAGRLLPGGPPAVTC